MRFPVPIFFMISGYFCKNNLAGYVKKIFATLGYIAGGELICVAIRLILVMAIGNDSVQIINGNISKKYRNQINLWNIF